MRILITGASGFFGGNLAKKFLDLNHEIVSIAHDEKMITTDKLLDIHKKITWCYGDLRDSTLIRRILADYEIENIIHLAAMPIERGGWRTTIPYFDTNINGTINVLEALLESSRNGFIVPLIYVSTDKVYGETNSLKSLEVDTFSPNSVYSASKTCADILAQTYSKVFSLPICVLRPCNLYGFGDYGKRIVPSTILNCLHDNNPIIYRNNTSTREYLYIDDACNLITRLIGKVEKLGLSVLNMGSGDTKSQSDVVFEILKHFPKLKPEYSDAPDYIRREIHYQALDSTKLHQIVGKYNFVKFEQGIKTTIDKYRKNII